MSKLSVIAASVAVLPALVFSAPAYAAAPGQIEGGDIYRAKNVTKNTDFADPIAATCGDTVQFKVRIHNPGPSRLDYVVVTATLPSQTAMNHTSKVTVASPDADPGETSDTAVVKLDKAGKLNYINGSTELLDHNSVKKSTLGDTILTTGVQVTDGVGVSINEKRFVQFSAKVNCDTDTPEDIKVCELKTKKVITIKETDFDASKHTTDLSKCGVTTVTPPTTLTKTGPGEVAALFAAAVALGTAAYAMVLRRQNAR